MDRKQVFIFYGRIVLLKAQETNKTRFGYSVGPHSGRLVLLWSTMEIWGFFLVNDMRTPPPLRSDQIGFLVQNDEAYEKQILDL